jgi:hypothetical protein
MRIAGKEESLGSGLLRFRIGVSLIDGDQRGSYGHSACGAEVANGSTAQLGILFRTGDLT